MSETVRAKAQDSLALVEEVNAVILPEPKAVDAVVPLSQADPVISEEIRSRMAEIDIEDSLRGIVSTIRGFSVSELDVRRDRSWWEKLLGRAAPFAKFTAKFEQVQGQIDRITDELLHHEHTLLKDIKSLDLLYDKTLQFYDELALYIAAGEEKLNVLDNGDIPAKEAEVQAAADRK